MADLQTLLHERAGHQCELCAHTEELNGVEVSGGSGTATQCSVLVCRRCSEQLATGAQLDPGHLYCLQSSIWSEVPVVQVVSWRLLKRMPQERWAADVLEQVYLEEEVQSWAEAGLVQLEEESPVVVDSNGATLNDGDAVTLIKDLSVKGANFTAKRGTLVKNIRLGDDPTHVEGRVNKMSIMLKTCFLKRVVS